MDGPDEPQIPGFLDFSLIGAGGSSKVYTAHQERFARTVAIKVVTVELSAEAGRRFEREQQTAGQLEGHPNVIRIYESGFTDAGQPYLVMEHHGQGSLADRLRRHGPLPVADVLEIGVKLAGALDAAHRRGVVHRDIKPQNVLLSPFAGPVLADFGIAVLDPGRFTVTTEAFSANHAAPEVLAGQPATASSDLYSLASLLYELLGGRPPFSDPERPDLLALIGRVQHDPVPRIGRPDLPAEAEAALVALLARDPADRPADGAAFAAALVAIQADLGLRPTEAVGLDAGGVPSPGGDVADDDSLWRPPPVGDHGTTDPSPVRPERAQDAPPPAAAEDDDHTYLPPPRGDAARPVASSAAAVPAESPATPPPGPPGDGTVLRRRDRSEPPSLPADPLPGRRGWLPWAGAAVAVLLVGAGIGRFVLADDEPSGPPPAPATTTVPIAATGPCPADADEQADIDLNDPTLSYERADAPTDVAVAVDPTDDSRATVTWVDVNEGKAFYVVLVHCTVDGEDVTTPIGKALPGAEPTATVADLAPYNYCFSVGALPVGGEVDGFVLGTAAGGDATEVCLDD